MSEFGQQLYPVLWLVLGVAFAVVEGLTVQLVVIWFTIGALAAAIAAICGASFTVQLVLFVVLSVLSLACTRPFMKRVLRVKRESTNADRVVGQTGIVKGAINNDLAQGRVQVQGMDWSARSVDGGQIPQGQKVLVKSIEGVKLMVEVCRQPKIETE